MSTDLLGVLFTFAVFGALVAWSLYAQVRTIRQRRAAWSALADRPGWSSTASRSIFPTVVPTMTVQGLIHGRRFWVHTESRGHGKHRHEVTVARLDLGDRAPGRLFTAPEGLGPSVRNLFRMSARELDDGELDSVIDMKRTSPEGRALLQDARMRELLLALYHFSSRFSLADGRLEAERRGIPLVADELEAFVTPVLKLGEALNAASPLPAEHARG
jgi:hypothetical protein